MSIVLLAAVLVLFCLPPLLVIRDTQSGRIYSITPCPEGTAFQVTFIHSVNLSPVTDTFRNENGRIRAVSTKFYAFGAGMPTEQNPGEVFVFTDDGAMEIQNLSQTYDRLSYIVNTVFDYTFTIHGKTINLQDLCGRNAHVEMVLWFS